MIVAKSLRKSNIVEYILYMWHIEEIILANGLNFFDLDQKVISKYKQPAELVAEIRNWYRQLINQMINEDLQEGEHLKFIQEIMFQLNDLHIQLLNDLQEEKYIEFYRLSQPILKDLRHKSHKENITEIELCLNALYGVMLLRMQGKEIGANTAEAIAVISKMMSYLGSRYHQIHKG